MDIWTTKDRKESGPEKSIRMLLQKNGIKFVQEYEVEYQLPSGRKGKKYYDFAIAAGKGKLILLEVHGTYFHCEDYVRGKTKKWKDLTKIQKQNIRNDRFKETLASSINTPLLVVWESEIADQERHRNLIQRIENAIEDIHKIS